MVTRYLSLISLEAARDLLRSTFPLPPRTVRVDLENAVHHRTATALFSRFSVPEHPLAAMDGIAVQSEETVGASEQKPVTLRRAIRLNTGNPLPAGFDAVIMIEDVWEKDGCYTIRKPVSPWQHIRPSGEDIAESEMVLPSAHRLRPHEIAALASYGITEIPIHTLEIALIPTGSELVTPGGKPGPGQAVESNTLLARAMLEQTGVLCNRYSIVPDEPDRIRAVLAEAVLTHDMVILSAGSSAGTRDYSATIMGELGQVLAHGVAIKPGKPVIIASIQKKPVIGLPGYPLSALTVLRELVIPFLAERGFTAPRYPDLSVILTTTLHSEIGTDEFVLLSAGKVGDHWVGVPQSRGAGVQMSAVRANAYLQIPAAKEGFEAGSQVTARLLVSTKQAESALLLTGSHDPALDHLADLLQHAGVELHSTHVGSMGGMLTLRRDECHAAPMHLLAPDGSYNVPYLQKYLPEEDLVLLCVAEREQGVISRKKITLHDLPGHRFVNRQKGSGTRMLLDHLLAREGIDPTSIPGYNREVTTHLAVALAVKNGEADAGIGVFSAAKAYGLSFSPLGTERYEIVARKNHSEDERMRLLFRTVASGEFRGILRSLGGYDVTETGVKRQIP
ncbi:MAG: molybdopterin biosynthesis protein [Methanomicrobiales archaeon]|nr:molybdopterin biosynthesis protein [Methanomicrobiales archaeon]